VILTSTNADRRDINKHVRERLESGGAVDSGKEYPTFQKAELNAVSRNFSSSYHEGQAIIFKNDCDAIKRGTQTTIVKTDEEKNNITVKYFDRESKSNKEAVVDCREHCAKMQVYDVVVKKFGVGDRVIFQKNDKAVNVKNGQTGVIKSIDEEGNARIDIGRDSMVECNLNNRGDRAYTYLDYSYCITSHKSQGSTYDKCIAVYDVSNHKTNFNEFYVAATRQREDVSIYTNSKEKFKEQAQEEQDKISTLDPVFRKFERRLEENRGEVARETKEKLSSFKNVDILEETQKQQPRQQEKRMEKPREKERDIGLDL
jgi:ATP-dependent exoDNAse (exonuclease V) alpha subunit